MPGALLSESQGLSTDAQSAACASDYLEALIRPAPWMAWRTYDGIKDGSKCVLQSERSHTFAVLEGSASEVWRSIEQGVSWGALVQEGKSRDWNPNELEAFIKELKDEDFIQFGEATSYIEPESAPTPQRLEFAENTDEEVQMMHWAAENGYLWSAHWEMTFRCNERCVHCYNPGAAHTPSEKPQRSRDELTTEEAYKLLDSLKAIGVFRLILSGGELTLRSDLLQIVSYARQSGFSVALYTNGLLLTDRLLNDLACLYPTSMSVSLYSADSSKHDAITGVPKSFERTLSAAKAIRSRNIKLYIKCPLMRDTVNDYGAVVTLAESLGAAPEIDMSLSDGADFSPIVQKLGVSGPVTLFQLALTPGSPLFIGTADEAFGRAPTNLSETACGAGSGNLYIDPEGLVSSCSSLPAKDLDFRRQSIEDAWARTPIGSRRIQRAPEEKTEIARWQTQVRSKYTECGRHDRCAWCSKCAGAAFLEHGDANRPASQNCFHAGVRMLAAFWRSNGVSSDALLLRATTFHSATSVFTHSAGLVAISRANGSQGDSNFVDFVPKTKGLELWSGSRRTAALLRDVDNLAEHLRGLLEAEEAKPPFSQEKGGEKVVHL